jgi:hypothetical protein
MVKCSVFFAVRTQLLNNSRVPAVLLRGTTVATWVTSATMVIGGDRGDLTTMVPVATVETCVTVATHATVVLERPWRLVQSGDLPTCETLVTGEFV